MSDLSQIIIEPALPAELEIPDFSGYSTDSLLTYVKVAESTYLTDDNRFEVKKALSTELITRIRTALLSDTEANIRINLKTKAQSLIPLFRAYAYTVCGYIHEPSFLAPSHLWSNSEIETMILAFVNADESLHTFAQATSVVDFLSLYAQRVSQEA